MAPDWVIDALQMPRWRHRPGIGLLVHTTRGSQCASQRFQVLLKVRDDVCNMSRKGHCRH
jgi:putative transposase